jgi:hypothetical protein
VAGNFFYGIISVQNKSGLINQNDSDTHPAANVAKKILEYWNAGIMVPFENPIFLHSIIPSFQRGCGSEILEP